MPVEFLTAEQEKRYGRYTAEPDPAQLARYFHLDDVDRELIALRRGPTRLSGPGLVGALQRLCEIRALGVGKLDLRSIPLGRLKALARFAAAVWAPNIAPMPSDRKTATLLAFARHFELAAMDDALDLLDALITELCTQAKRAGQRKRLRSLRDLDAAARQLGKVCELLLDENCEGAELRKLAFARVPKERLQQAIQTVDLLTRPPDDKFYEELTERHGRARRFLPTLLEMISFESAQAGQPVLKAWKFLASLEGQRKPDMSNAPLKIVPAAWKRLVVGSDKLVDRRAYTLCVLEQLQDALRRRDLYVAASERWGDPRAKLLQGAAWEALRPQVCRTLQRQADVGPELDKLSTLLDDAYRRTASMGYGIVVQTGTNQFMGAGSGFRVAIRPLTPGPKYAGIGTVDEGKFEGDKWVEGRRLNGDETDQGGGWRFAFFQTGAEKCTVYRYD